MISMTSYTKMCVESHPHIRKIMLYYFEKGWKRPGHSATSKTSRRLNNQPKPTKKWGLPLNLPYSPAETFMDYHVSRSLKNWLGNRSYDDLDDLMADVKAWIASKDQNLFAFEIQQSSQWEAMHEVDGG
ncbi:unnamed protein product [Haemonchus placei]|uniref:Transposase n=1 Tax=Haemonchus placei TaxID=6290 RepID=A0A0N4VTB3_HAEPC|nr:unnamed protein product [Haemonchus placei]